MEKTQIPSQHPPALIGVSHGTASPEGQEAIMRLMSELSEKMNGVRVASAFVDVQEPKPETVLASLPPGEHAVLVPILLSDGYHIRSDLGEASRSDHTRKVVVAKALGPDPLLIEILEHRLRELGSMQAHISHDASIILGCAGTRVPEGVDACKTTADMLSERLSRTVTCAFVSAASPSIENEYARLRAENPKKDIVISSYMLAPGFFHSRLKQVGGAFTTDALLSEKEEPQTSLVSLIIERYTEACAQLP